MDPNFPNSNFSLRLRGFFLLASQVTHLNPSDGVRKTEKALDLARPNINHSLSSLRALINTITIKHDGDQPSDHDEDSGPPDDSSGGSTQEEGTDGQHQPVENI